MRPTRKSGDSHAARDAARPVGDGTEFGESGRGDDASLGPPEVPTTSLVERLRTAAGVIAPTTLIAALLYYYGYVTTLARFAYFGVDLSTLRMSTQDLALRSVEALYVPLAALLAAGLVGFWLHTTVRAFLVQGKYTRLLQRGGWLAITLGTVLLVRAVIGIIHSSIAANEFPGITPISLGLGALLMAYGRHLVTYVSPDQNRSQRRRRLERVVWTAVSGIAVLSLFWLTNSFAAAYGRGQADVDSLKLGTKPSVTLDTKERLYLGYPGVEETHLPIENGQQFRYRYRGLRLLIESDSRLFLIPERWRKGGNVLVLPEDSSVRVQFGR